MIKKIFLLVLFFFFLLNNTFSYYTNDNINNSYHIGELEFNSKDKKEISRELSFIFLTELTLKEIPDSYKYIKLNYLDIKKGQKIYDSLQKLVYLNLINNKKNYFYKNKKINAYYFYLLFEKISQIKIEDKDFIVSIKNRNLMLGDLKLIKKLYTYDKNNIKKTISEKNNFEKNIEIINSNHDFLNVDSKNYQKFQILIDVYKTLLNGHYYNDNFSSSDLIYGAISGIAEGTGDKFTTFFPPTETKDFEESLSGEFEGIGAYVEMEKPGILKIISPLSGSPAEKAGLKGGDIIIKVDSKEITKDMPINKAVKLIKGPSGTKVILTILRDDKEFNVEVIRDKIIIKDVEYSVLNNKFHYIKIRMFGNKVLDEFNESIQKIKDNPNIKNIVIDLRNNPGGYLDSVTKMLDNFVPKGSSTAIVKYKTGNVKYISNSDDILDLNKYNIFILINSGSASASEIMAGTLKDYYPNIKIIGEKSYGKGSVQTIKTYVDGSSLKYTIANWYTGKSEKSIDKTGITPDIEIILDTDKFKNGFDNQLDYILKNY